jgi:phospho-N-acetylmuramoyl-pentapeptide-transferase
MFKEFLYPLVEYFSPFNIFQYITFRAAYAAVTSLLITFLFGHQIIELLKQRHIGEEIRSDGPSSHALKAGTPTMGGIMIIFSTAFSVFLWMDPRNLYTWISLLAILGFGAVGFIDDYIKVYIGKRAVCRPM